MEKHDIKILYFIQLPPPVHGVSTVNKLIWNSSFINKNVEKHLLQIRFSTRLDELRKINIRKIIMFFRLRKELKQKIMELRPDLVYFSFMPVGKGFWRDLIFALVIKRMKVKTIFHLNNRGIKKRNHRSLYIRMIRKIFSNSMIIHVSQKLLNEEIHPLGLTNARTAFLPNVTAEIQPVRGTANNDRIRILFVSNLFPSKGIYELIRIFQLLAKEHNNIELLIMGDFMRRRYRNSFFRMLRSVDVFDRICLLGARFGEEKWKVYQKADIFLFPSMFDEECMPLVVLEAMMFALPVVTSDIGAMSDIVRHKTNGFLIQPKDTRMFVRALNLLICDKQMREQMGQAGRDLYLENYALDKFEVNLHHILMDYLGMNE